MNSIEAAKTLRRHIENEVREAISEVESRSVRTYLLSRTETWLQSISEKTWERAQKTSINLSKDDLSIQGLSKRTAGRIERDLKYDIETITDGRLKVKATHAHVRQMLAATLIKNKIAEETSCSEIGQIRKKVMSARWGARDAKIVVVTLGEIMWLTSEGGKFWKTLGKTPAWLRRQVLRDLGIRNKPTEMWTYEATRSNAKICGWNDNKNATPESIDAILGHWRWKSIKPPLIAVWACATQGFRPNGDAGWVAMMGAEEQCMQKTLMGLKITEQWCVEQISRLEDEAPKTLEKVIRNQAVKAVEEALAWRVDKRNAKEVLETIERDFPEGEERKPTLVPTITEGIVRTCEWQVMYTNAAQIIGGTRMELGKRAAERLPELCAEHTRTWTGFLQNPYETEEQHQRWSGRRRSRKSRATKHGRWKSVWDKARKLERIMTNVLDKGNGR